MAKLGDLYFDVLIQDKTDKQIASIREKLLKKLKLNINVSANELRSQLRDAISGQPFKVNIIVDQASATQAVREALQRIGYNLTGSGITAGQARAAKAARDDLLAQAKAQAIAQAAADKHALAQQRLANAQARSGNAAKRQGASVRMVNNQLRVQVPLLESLTNMARNYVGVFGFVSAIRSLYNIRAEFERQEVALRALMQSASQATQTMNELQAMALRSPFKVSDIISFTKQLSAFSIPNNELVDTTKRLADLSAGLGVDMSRIILAYGQVRAATVLRGQELRQFTEAGIPMVQALADNFTKLEGRVVTAGEVFERISKKMVKFEDVKKVLFDMTDEGGRFFNHQEKMVETLYGKIERMSDAWRVMMNELGRANDSGLKAPIDAITKAMLNWRSTLSTIASLVTFSASRKLMPAILGGSEVEMISRKFKAASKSTNRFSAALGVMGSTATRAGSALHGLIASNMWAILATLIADIVYQIVQFNSATDDFGNRIRQMGAEVSQDIGQFMRDNRVWLDRLATGMGDTSEQEKGWERLREQIEGIDKSGTQLAKLMQNSNLRKRNQEAVELLHTLQEVSDFLANRNNFGSVTQDIFHGFLGEGLGTDAKQLQEWIDDLRRRLDESGRDVFGRDLKQLIADDAISNMLPDGSIRGRLEEFNDEIAKSVEGSLIPTLQQAWQSGITNPAALQQIVTTWRATALAATPELVGESLEQFDAVMHMQLNGLRGELGDIFRNPDNFDMTVPESVFSDFLSQLDRAARAQGEDLRMLVRSGSTDTIESIAKKMVSEGAYATEEIQEQFVWLANNIEALQPRFTVRLNVVEERDSNFLTGLISSTGLNRQEFNEQYRVPNGVTTDKEAAESIRKAIAENNDKIKQNTTNIERSKKLLKGWNKSMASVTREVSEAARVVREGEAENKRLNKEVKQYNNTLKALGQPEFTGTTDDLDSHGDAKKNKPSRRSGGRSGSRKDVWLEQLKEQYAEYEAANKEFLQYARVEGDAAARERVAQMERFSQLNQEYIGRRGMAAYINSILPDAEAHAASLKAEARHATNAFVKKLKDAIDKDAFDELQRGITAIQNELQRRIDTSSKNWNLYDRVFSAIGNDRFASLASFGGKKLFRSYTDELKKIFNENGKISFGDALSKSDAELKELLGDTSKYIDLLKKIRELESDERIKFIEDGANAMAQQMDAAQKIAALEAKRERLINDTYAKYGKKSGSLTLLPPDILASLGAQVNAINNEIAQLNDESLKLSATWEHLFDNIGVKTTASLKVRLKEADDLLAQYVDIGNGKYRNKNTGKIITQETYKQIRDQRRKVLEDMKELDPIKMWKDTVKSKPGSAAWFGEMGVAIQKFSDQLKNATGPMKEFFSALGNDEVGDFVDLAHEMADGISQMALGASEIASGNYVGGSITALGGLFSTITSWFNFHDKRMERIIERSKLEVKRLENAYAEIERALQRTLGGIYASSNEGSYNGMLANLRKQYEEIEKQRDAERSKKKSDKDALLDYDKQLSEMRDNIEHFAEDMADSIYNINVKNWASELTDAVIDAWASGEDAAEAYGRKVHDIIKSVTKNIIAQRVMEAALQPVLDDIVREMTAKDGKLDEESIMTFANELIARGAAATNVITGILDKLRENGFDLADTAAADTLGKGIQNITEDTADLLASYINAMRADLAYIRYLQEQDANMTSPIAMQQMQQMQTIASNTLRNAEAAERIEEAINSVIAVGANGKRIRV